MRMPNAVRDNPERQRYELDIEGDVAYVNYRRAAGVVTLTYARVPDALQGRGFGAQLVQGTLELIRARGEKVVPQCGYVALYMRRHAEVSDLLA